MKIDEFMSHDKQVFVSSNFSFKYLQASVYGLAQITLILTNRIKPEEKEYKEKRIQCLDVENMSLQHMYL